MKDKEPDYYLTTDNIFYAHINSNERRPEQAFTDWSLISQFNPIGKTLCYVQVAIIIKEKMEENAAMFT